MGLASYSCPFYQLDRVDQARCVDVSVPGAVPGYKPISGGSASGLAAFYVEPLAVRKAFKVARACLGDLGDPLDQGLAAVNDDRVQVAVADRGVFGGGHWFAPVRVAYDVNIGRRTPYVNPSDVKSFRSGSVPLAQDRAALQRPAGDRHLSGLVGLTSAAAAGDHGNEHPAFPASVVADGAVDAGGLGVYYVVACVGHRAVLGFGLGEKGFCNLVSIKSCLRPCFAYGLCKLKRGGPVNLGEVVFIKGIGYQDRVGKIALAVAGPGGSVLEGGCVGLHGGDPRFGLLAM